MADDACRSGQADGWTSGQGGKAADGWADEGGKGANSGAEGRTGPTRRGHADGQKRRGRGPGGTDGPQHARTGGRADWVVRACIAWTAGRADGRTGGLGGRADWANERTGG